MYSLLSHLNDPVKLEAYPYITEEETEHLEGKLTKAQCCSL